MSCRLPVTKASSNETENFSEAVAGNCIKKVSAVSARPVHDEVHGNFPREHSRNDAYIHDTDLAVNL